MLEERRADALAVCLRVDVEECPEVSVEGEEAGHAVVALGHPDVLPVDDAGEEGDVLLVRVELREEIERGEGALEHVDDLLDVCGRSASEHGRRLRACASATSPSV